MRSILHGLLVIAISFGYVMGSSVTVEVEHSHGVGGGHGHEHGETDGEHDHHSHEHDSHSPADDSQDGEQDSDHHPHSHVVSLGSDVPFVLPNFPKEQTIHSASSAYSLPDPDRCPDGPYFPLIKPPQLG
jgi:hypothetical protein